MLFNLLIVGIQSYKIKQFSSYSGSVMNIEQVIKLCTDIAQARIDYNLGLADTLKGLSPEEIDTFWEEVSPVIRDFYQGLNRFQCALGVEESFYVSVQCAVKTYQNFVSEFQAIEQVLPEDRKIYVAFLLAQLDSHVILTEEDDIATIKLLQETARQKKQKIEAHQLEAFKDIIEEYRYEYEMIAIIKTFLKQHAQSFLDFHNEYVISEMIIPIPGQPRVSRYSIGERFIKQYEKKFDSIHVLYNSVKEHVAAELAQKIARFLDGYVQLRESVLAQNNTRSGFEQYKFIYAQLVNAQKIANEYDSLHQTLSELLKKIEFQEFTASFEKAKPKRRVKKKSCTKKQTSRQDPALMCTTQTVLVPLEPSLTLETSVSEKASQCEPVIDSHVSEHMQVLSLCDPKATLDSVLEKQDKTGTSEVCEHQIVPKTLPWDLTVPQSVLIDAVPLYTPQKKLAEQSIRPELHKALAKPEIQEMITTLAHGQIYKRYSFEEMIDLVKALGGRIENKSGSVRRLYLPSPFSKDNAVVDTIANERVDAPHSGKKQKEKIGSKFAAHFRRLLDKAGFIPENLWKAEIKHGTSYKKMYRD